MAYATTTAILTLFPGLPQTSTSSGYSVTVALIAQHITKADSVINGKISSRYDVSDFSATPALLQHISEDVAGYYTHRSIYSGDDQNTNEWTDKLKEAMMWLDEIREGKMDLTDAADALIGDDSTVFTVSSNTEDYDLTFNTGDPVNWEVDPDYLDTL